MTEKYRWVIGYVVEDGELRLYCFKLVGDMMDKPKAVCYHDGTQWNIIAQNASFTSEEIAVCMGNYLEYSSLIDDFPAEMLLVAKIIEEEESGEISTRITEHGTDETSM